MDVKQAILRARQYVADIFSMEGATNVGLEEIEFDPEAKVWLVTIGFSRPWDIPPQRYELLPFQTTTTPRSYKVVRIDEEGNILSVKNR